ncbi:MAG: MBL fold metallo-hydrolase [Lachnospiraceae bacterium]|nr:MBL fold metallo-hydrolase [Lachnospiraceae bacterium]
MSEIITEPAPGIFQIHIPIPHNPLREGNAYFLRGNAAHGDLLVDTGFKMPECREVLEKALTQLGADRTRLRVLCTHMHADHCGLADEFAGPEGPIYMSARDLVFWKDFRTGTLQTDRAARYATEGMPEDILNRLGRTGGAYPLSMSTDDARLTGVPEGGSVRAGDRELRLILVPGHTPGNSMYYIEEEQILFTGDHVLFDITPNITYWPGQENPLRDYLESLRRVRDIPVRLALPGHRESGDYRARVDELLESHRMRLAEVESILQEEPGLSAFEVTRQMHWRVRAAAWKDVPDRHKWFAFGEGLAHLDYLCAAGRVRRELTDGTWRYYAL